MANEGQILIGKEIVDGAEHSQNFYQMMIDGKIEASSIYACEVGSKFIDIFHSNAAQGLSMALAKRGITNCRIYNGVLYNSETKKFVEIDSLSPLEETIIMQTLKIVGGVLVDHNN